MPFKKESSSSSPYGSAGDQSLISACLTGDANAWDALLDRYAALIYSCCLRAGVSRADADDIFQDVCLILFNHLASLRDTTKISGWLISTTKREAWRHLRKQSPTLSSEFGEGAWDFENAESLHPQSSGGNPESDIMALEEQQMMRQAMTRLPERCRNLLTQLYATDAPPGYQEIAKKLSLPVGSIGPTRARCLQQLRKIMKELDT